MASLGTIAVIANNIKTVPFPVIKAFYKLLFETEANRTSRKKVREFTGFKFEIASEEYEQKLLFINDNFSSNDLTAIANILRINYDAPKDELIKRICDNLLNLNNLQRTTEQNDEEEEDGEEIEEIHGEQDAQSVHSVSINDVTQSISSLTQQVATFAMNYKDVEDSIRTFDGTSAHSVEKWISDFEETSTVFGWGEMHKFIFAKRSIKGLAKLYIQSEKGLNSWSTLKQSLVAEFSHKLNSAQLHQMLAKRKLGKNETIQEYFLHMKELASRGDVDTESLLQYVIDGIPDTNSNKMMLYGAKNINEFKAKIKVYDEFKNKSDVKFNYPLKEAPPRNFQKPKEERTTTQPTRCYNCGVQGHKSSNCNSRRLGSKCFKCNQFGHKSYDCNEGSEQSKKNKAANVNKIAIDANDRMCKNIQINGFQVKVLIDTGSQVNILKKQVYENIGSPELYKADLKLNGFGKCSIHTTGYFKGTILIDDDTFIVKIYVVENDVMNVSGIMGSEIFTEADLLITEDGVKITKRKPPAFLMKIDMPSETELDIGIEAKEESRNKIKQMISAYRPKKSKTTNLEVEKQLLPVEDVEITPEPEPGTSQEEDELKHEEMVLPNDDDEDDDDDGCVSIKKAVIIKSQDGVESSILKLDEEKHDLNNLQNKLKSHECEAFQKTMDKKDLSTGIAKWFLMLGEYDYIVEHRSGTRMRHVDSLSRNPIALIEANRSLVQIREAQELDETLRAIKEILKEKSYEDYFMKNDVLYKRHNDDELLVIPKNMQTDIIHRAHEDGHLSIQKTEQVIMKDYYIPNLKAKIKRVIASCIPCILVTNKKGKQEGFLHPLHKEQVPIHTYHIDHLGPLESTSKKYKHILVVVDAFTKFTWLYPTKSTTAAEVITKLDQQKIIFGNPVNIISDRGTAFTANEFEDYCTQEGIKHFKVTTGLPRANGQVERINSVIVPVLSKLSIEDPAKWFKYVGKVQQIINSSRNRSIATTPFELLTGVPMRSKADEDVKLLIEEEMKKSFDEAREKLRERAKMQIMKIQEENKKSFNRKRRPPIKYKVNDEVAIKRTQFGSGMKLKSKFLGPYRVSKVKTNDTYDVQKKGFHDGPKKTTTCAEYMKPWAEDPQSSGSDDEQDGRVVGMKAADEGGEL